MRCNYLFKNEVSNYNIISSKVVAHGKEFSSYAVPQPCKNLVISNFSTFDGLFIFITTVWHDENVEGGAGLFVSNSKLSILLMGYSPILASSKMDADANALEVAFNSISNNTLSVQHIFISFHELLATIIVGYCLNDWRSNHWVNTIHNLIILAGNPRINVIPKCRIGATSKLAMHGSSLHNTSLFHQARTSLGGS